MNDASIDNSDNKPPLGLYYSEALRAGFELSMLSTPQARSLLENVPRGKKHPVVVIPGFTASDKSTKVLRTYIRRLGYTAYGWRQGVNFGVRHSKIEGVLRHIDAAVQSSGSKVSLVGQSLGGIYSREIAKAFPDHIEQVICLGSPFMDIAGAASRVSSLYEHHNPEHLSKTEQFEKEHWELPEPPPVPMSSIYSRWDGVCHWSACVQRGGHDRCENIEVHSSHTGMGVNASVFFALADRLAQAQCTWLPFEPPRELLWMFPPTAPAHAAGH